MASQRYACVAAACALGAATSAARADDLRDICSGARLPLESPAFERFDLNGDDRLSAEETAQFAEAFTPTREIDGAVVSIAVLGPTVVVVPGHEEAFKVTRPLDLVLAEAVLARRRLNDGF